MSDEFRPRLGRPGDRGGSAAKRYGARIKRAAKRRAKPKGKSGFSGERIGRGSAAARMAQMRSHPFAKFRMRRAVVKVHIARAGKGIGRAAFRAHVKYIQRDGASLENERGEPSGGDLYNRDRERVDDREFLARSEHDPHQFRIILSPEDADQLGDLKDYTREVMAQAEKDLGTSLDWVAVDHHNTGHPHTHVVIRGKDGAGRDLVIARDYLTQGLRARAQEIAMERLGPRRDLEIARGAAREVEAERVTGIDRRLAAQARDNVVEIAPAAGASCRFERTLTLRRLSFFETRGFAEKVGAARWRFATGWEERLRALALERDVIRSIAAAAGKELAARDIKVFDGTSGRPDRILGRVVASGPTDELRDTRFLVIDAADGKVWRVSPGDAAPGALPPAGAIVEARAAVRRARQSDRTIARIADINRGRYSAALHAADDPTPSKVYIEAHKRRLEALRRAGIVARATDGSWRIGRDFLDRTARYEAARGGGVKFEVKSWIDLEAQVGKRAPTWLDDVNESEIGGEGFGAEAAAAKARRAKFLRREGLWSEEAGGIDAATRRRLAESELAEAGESQARRIGKTYRAFEAGGSFDGVFERSVDLVQGRFALIGRSKEFTLVPWRPEIEKYRGAALMVYRSGKGIEWTPGRARGIGW